MSDSPLDAIRNLTNAWMKKDASEMARWLTPDIIEIGPAFGKALSGYTDFFKRYRAYLRGPRQVLTYRILQPKIATLSPRMVVVFFNYRMRTRSGAVVEKSHGKESMIVLRARGHWRVRYIHWHRDG